MKALLNAVTRTLGLKRKTALDQEALEQLRELHRKRCHHFRLLLAANNTALQIMAELEEALAGARPFGVSYVRARCVRVCASTHQLIHHLGELSGGKYATLFERHHIIQQRINDVLSANAPVEAGPLTLDLSEIGLEHAEEVGGKMATLAEAARKLDLPAPEGFVITASAYRRFMEANDLQAEIDRMIQSAEPETYEECLTVSAAVQRRIVQSPLPKDLEEAILAAHARLRLRIGERERLALRSSALGEDLEESSFAGQYRSELNVGDELFLDAYKDIVASKYGVTAMSYRQSRGIPDEGVAMCVGCMRVIDAQSGGVAYSRNPMAADDDAVIISSVFGLPQAVVDGSVGVDRFEVSRSDPPSVRRSSIALKSSRCVLDVEGVKTEALDDAMALRPSLDRDQIVRLTDMVLRIEELFGQAQDVEWAVDPRGLFYLLQCRPLHLTPEATEPGEALAEGQILQGGVTASPGAAAGPVHTLRKDVDALNAPANAVLVAAQAQPRWAPLLCRAAALVAEQGGETGHLANVAREFHVPALFGLPGAMDMLEGRELVTVDADARRVYEGRVEAVLVERAKPKNLMLNSPIHNLLQEAVKHIVPLRLLDPESPDFAPSSCETLHDITRFCHEMAVREVYSTRYDVPFPEKSSKQLWHGRPMQYWIVDLDDGFLGEVSTKLVTLEQIASVPMLALWRGMTAVPLEGPPPMDAKGFLAVMVESTTNPELDPSLASSFQVRNYFLISRDYCSLQSRFGFHFCTVEAQIGQDADANYISFQFKGGAADLPRRVARALLLADLLEELGFRVEVKQDSLFSRIEGFPPPIMEDRLAAVGHLVMHTRQMDMIMGNPTEAAAARNRLREELARFDASRNNTAREASPTSESTRPSEAV